MSLWWIEKPYLAASAHPDQAELETLFRQGFKLVVSFLDDSQQPLKYCPERLEPLGLSFHSFPVKDFNAPSLEQLSQFTELLRAMSGVKVLLHCQAGKGRTGTFAAAFLIALRGYTATEDIAQIRQLRPGAIETEAQEAILQVFENKQ